MEEHFQEVLEKILIFYTQGKFETEFLKARNEFFQLTGQIEEDHEDFEIKMNIFHEWYLFDYNQSSIFEEYLRNPVFEEGGKETLKTQRHSLFEYGGKTFRGQDYFKDFVADEKIYLSEEARRPALVKDDLFIGRFVKFRDHYFQLPGLGILPKKIRSYLIKSAQKVGSLKDQDKKLEFLLNLHSMRNKWKRYAHLDPAKIFI